MRDPEKHRATSRDYYWKNRDKILPRQRAYYYDHLSERRAYIESNREKIRGYWKKYHADPSSRARKRWYRYGLSPEQFKAIFDRQDNRCAICETFDFKPFCPVIDHCHVGNYVRGILCHRCNSMLGMSRDSAETLSKAIQYLTK